MEIKLTEQTLLRTGTKVEKHLLNSLPTKVVYPGKNTQPYKAGIRNITALGIQSAKTMLKDIFAQCRNKISNKG